jgi:hypothetical protein
MLVHSLSSPDRGVTRVQQVKSSVERQGTRVKNLVFLQEFVISAEGCSSASRSAARPRGTMHAEEMSCPCGTTKVGGCWCTECC